MKKETKQRSPWAWVPTMYFAQGLPYVTVMTLAVVMFKDLGLTNDKIALYTSWLYLPWVIKPIWSPIIDLIKTKRMWVILMQTFVSVAFAGIAFSIPTTFFLQTTMAFFWLMAFSSATYDIAADGFYMLGLSIGDQALFVGIRNTAYRLATIFVEGGLVVLVGFLAKGSIIPGWEGNYVVSWSACFFLLAAIFLGLTIWHSIGLPRPASDVSRDNVTFSQLMKDFVMTFVDFFKKNDIGLALFFILTYRLGESQLLKLAIPFLKDPMEAGGLGLGNEHIGMIKGTFGVAALLVGGIIGGICISKGGLKKWIIPMALAINIPDALYIYLAYAQPENIWAIIACVVGEQLGYGFGFTAFTLYLVYVAQGAFKTAHYSIGTGLMALGMMVPSMFAGKIQMAIGYPMFFIIVCLFTLPGILASVLVMRRLPAGFGIKTKEVSE